MFLRKVRPVIDERPNHIVFERPRREQNFACLLLERRLKDCAWRRVRGMGQLYYDCEKNQFHLIAMMSDVSSLIDTKTALPRLMIFLGSRGILRRGAKLFHGYHLQ